MGTKQVRLEEDVYELIKDKKREGETFSEAIERLTSEWTITDYGGDRSEEEIERHKKMLDEMDQESIDDVDRTLRKMGVDVE